MKNKTTVAVYPSELQDTYKVHHQALLFGTLAMPSEIRRYKTNMGSRLRPIVESQAYQYTG